ncbi:MAG: hypothetical protein NC223_08830 [Butyrivibrio sp.]|nr:hypothetical protein [Butyrivibrio sp.]
MEAYQLIIIIAAVVAVIALIGFAMSRSAKKSLRARLSSSFGELSKQEFTYEEYESISHFFRNTLKDGEFYIDDITWHDLDMDRLFLMINNTNSSVGRDALYKILRKPVADREILAERERLMEYFDTHGDARTDIMECFCNIGFARRISVSDHMENLLKLKPQSNFPHIAMLLCIIFALAYTLTVDAVLGVGLIIAASGVSIVSYYKYKSRIDSFFECVRQLVCMVGAADKISRMQLPELSEYNAYFADTVSRLRKITRNSFVLVSRKNNSGSLADIVMEYVKMFTHADLMKFNSVLRHFDRNYNEVVTLMDRLGLIEAMISAASFRRLMPYMCRPVFEDGGKTELKNVYHLGIKEPVANSFSESRPLLVTGSNASGKSTFLKSVAISAILAQTLNTCPADFYKAPFYRVYSSMALSDDIASGESYYIVEIKSLKRIVDAAKETGMKVMCFIDEVLRGTNTVERIAASSEILKSLADNGVMCFAATHDIELTHILEKIYSNYHFDEEVRDGNVVFSYELKHGRASSRNAIKLLGIIGYDDDVIRNSEERANDFINTGIWRHFQ